MLSVQVGANIQGLQNGLNSAQSSLQGFVARSTASLETLSTSFKDLGSKLLPISVSLGLIGKTALSNGADLESLKLGLRSIEEQQYGVGKASSYATARFEEYRKIALLPGIGLESAIKTSIGLRSVGFTADEAKREILAFGNALALVGKGKNELNGVALQIQQLSGKTSGFGADLRVIKEYAPQVGGALIKAFGTLDTEAIAKTGVTGKQVIEKITLELEKLPKAAGGLKNAFDNVGDAVFISSGRIGEALNKSLGIQDLAEKFSGYLSKIADKFEALSPTAQKAIGIIAGIAVILPPILIGIGLMLPAIGAIGTAFIAITSPIGAVVAGLAILAYEVVTHWTEVKGFLQDTGIWNGLVSLVQNTFGVIKGVFTVTINTIKSIWNYGLSVIHNDTFGIFSVITGIFSSALTTISGIVGIFSNLLQGNWKGLGESMKQTFGGVFNFIITMTEGFVRVLVGSFQKVFELFGADKIVSQFKQAGESLKKTFEGFKYKITGENEVKGGTGKPKDTKIEGGLNGGVKPNGAKELTDEQKKALKEREKEEERFQTESTNLLEKTFEEQRAIQEKASEGNLRLLIDYKTKEFASIKAGINAQKVAESVKHLALLSAEDKFQQELQAIKDKYKPTAQLQTKGVSLGGIGSKLGDGSDGFGLVGASSKLGLQPITDSITRTLPALKAKLAEITGVLLSASERMRRAWESLGNSGKPTQALLKFALLGTIDDVKTGLLKMAQTLDGGAKNILGGFGKVVGAMAIGKDGIADIGSMLLQGFGSILVSLGEQMIAQSTLFATAASAIALALTPAGAGLALVAGIGLIAAGTALGSVGSSGGGGSSSGGSYGGYSPSYGNGSNYSAGGNNAMTIDLSGTFRIAGNDLVHTIQRNEKHNYRTNGH